MSFLFKIEWYSIVYVYIFIHTQHILLICLSISGHLSYSKSLTYRPSSCKLSKKWMWIHMSNHVRHEWNCSLPAVSCCCQSVRSAISHLLSLPVSNSSYLFTQCQPPYASCRTVLVYLSRCCTVRLNMFYFFKYVIILVALGLCCCVGPSLVVVSGLPLLQSTGFGVHRLQ